MKTSRWKIAFPSLIGLSLCAGAFAQSLQPLFRGAPALTSAQGSNAFALRENFVTVDWRAMAADARIAEEVTRQLNLNLFEDARFIAERTRLTWLAPGRFNWIGRIGDDDVILAVRDGHMVGVVQKDDRVWEIRSVDGLIHQIVESDQARFAQIDRLAHTDLVPDDHDTEPTPSGTPPAGDPTVIDVMVFYSPSVKTKNPNIEAYLASLIELSNVSYERSRIPQVIRLVHHDVATRCHTSNGNSCMNTDTAIVALRKRYGADLTGLIYDGSAGFCGVSNGGCCQTSIYSCALSNKSFPHEFGHNMGAGHDYQQSSTAGYAHGYVNNAKRWRTIMAYPNCTNGCPRINNFSNPQVMHNNDPTGTAAREDNARRMRERMATVAAREPTRVGPVGVREKVIRDAPAAFSVRGLSRGMLDLHVRSPERLSVAFYSLRGGKVEVANREFGAGNHQLTWDPGRLSSGIQVLVLRGRSGQKSYKLMMMR